MSYISRYSGKGLLFAVPNIVIEYPRETFLSSSSTPSSLLSDIPPSSSFRPAIRIWSYSDCPASINLLSHAFVHLREERRKIARNVAMGCYAPQGLKSIPPTFKKRSHLCINSLDRSVRVSVHPMGGTMACSPNNAQLILSPLPPPHRTRSFWYLVIDGSNVEVTFNILLSEKEDIEGMYAILKDVSSKGNQTTFGDFLNVMQAKARESGVYEEILHHIVKALHS